MLTPVFVLAPALFAAVPATARDFAFRVESSDPALAGYADETKAVCEEWYPKINEILYGPGHPLPYREVKIVFGNFKLAGRAGGDTIELSSDWLKKPHVLDWRAVVIHELTHTVQAYPDAVMRLRTDGLHGLVTFFRVRLFMPNRGMEWLQEGIADYVTYTYFTKTNEAKLRLDKNGYLFGYTETIPYLFGLQQGKIRPDGECRQRRVRAGKGYRHGYTVTSAFLLWLEARKDKDIVRKLNAALRQDRCSARLFKQHCGASLDALWSEFLAQSRM